MRMAIGFLFLSCIGIAAQGQAATGPLDTPIMVRTLNIVSNEVSPELKQNIVRAYRGKTYTLEELGARIRSGMRDLGYAKASVSIPQLKSMPIPSPGQPEDVTVEITPGAIYLITGIQFERVSAFPADMLRRQFPIADGAVFKLSAITNGLDNLRSIYASQGYINFGARPKVDYDEGQLTLALTIALDEGPRYQFGSLSLKGNEPSQVASNKLVAAWKSLEGKPYDYRLLENWLSANAAFLPGVVDSPEKAAEKYVTANQNEASHHVDIELRLP